MAPYVADTTNTASDTEAITPDDDNDLARPARALKIGVSGTLRITTLEGNVRNLPATIIVAGATLEVGVKRVHANGTTATAIWALY